MSTPTADLRSPQQRALDEQIASEPPIPLPDLPPGAVTSPLEAHLASLPRPLA